MRKPKGTEKIEIHEGSGNVYRDLGFPDAEGMLVKAQLVSKIGEIIRSKGLTQIEAAKILGLPQPKLDRKSTRLNSSHIQKSRMPSSA